MVIPSRHHWGVRGIAPVKISQNFRQIFETLRFVALLNRKLINTFIRIKQNNKEKKKTNYKTTKVLTHIVIK